MLLYLLSAYFFISIFYFADHYTIHICTNRGISCTDCVRRELETRHAWPSGTSGTPLRFDGSGEAHALFFFFFPSVLAPEILSKRRRKYWRTGHGRNRFWNASANTMRRESVFPILRAKHVNVSFGTLRQIYFSLLDYVCRTL